MKIDTRLRGDAIVRKILATTTLSAAADYEKERVVRFAKGCGLFRFTRLSDGLWRLSSASSYGNGAHYYGAACDASGYVLKSAHCKILAAMSDAHIARTDPENERAALRLS